MLLKQVLSLSESVSIKVCIKISLSDVFHIEYTTLDFF